MKHFVILQPFQPGETSCDDSPENGKCKRSRTEDTEGQVGKTDHDDDQDPGGNAGETDLDAKYPGGNAGETDVDAQPTERSPTTQCVVVVTRPSLPEVPAQYQIVPERLINFIGLDQWVEDNRGDPFYVISCEPEKGSEMTERDDKDESVPGVTREPYPPSAACRSDDDTIQPVTRPSLPEIPAMLIHKRVLRAVGIESSDTVNYDLPLCSTQTPDGNGDQVETRGGNDDTQYGQDNGGHSDDYDVQGRKVVTMVSNGDVTMTTDCVDDDEWPPSATRPSLPEVPAVLRKRYRNRGKTLDSISVGTKGNGLRRKQSRCKPKFATQHPIERNGDSGNGGGNENGGRESSDYDFDPYASVTTHPSSITPVITQVSNRTLQAGDETNDGLLSDDITHPPDYLPQVPAVLKRKPSLLQMIRIFQKFG